jgi:hypothetical protein
MKKGNFNTEFNKEELLKSLDIASKRLEKNEARNLGIDSSSIEKALGEIDDEALLILKCNLLLEERINEIIASSNIYPLDIEKLKLSYYQKLCFVKEVLKATRITDILFTLHELRNIIAHSLKLDLRIKKVEKLRQICIKSYENMSIKINKLSSKAIILFSLNLVLGYLRASFDEGFLLVSTKIKLIELENLMKED